MVKDDTLFVKQIIASAALDGNTAFIDLSNSMLRTQHLDLACFHHIVMPIQYCRIY